MCVCVNSVSFFFFFKISEDDIDLQIRTQYMRIVPLDFVEFPCMRIEIFGCKCKPRFVPQYIKSILTKK